MWHQAVQLREETPWRSVLFWESSCDFFDWKPGLVLDGAPLPFLDRWIHPQWTDFSFSRVISRTGESLYCRGYNHLLYNGAIWMNEGKWQKEEWEKAQKAHTVLRHKASVLTKNNERMFDIIGAVVPTPTCNYFLSSSSSSSSSSASLFSNITQNRASWLSSIMNLDNCEMQRWIGLRSAFSVFLPSPGRNCMQPRALKVVDFEFSFFQCPSAVFIKWYVCS